MATPAVPRLLGMAEVEIRTALHAGTGIWGINLSATTSVSGIADTIHAPKSVGTACLFTGHPAYRAPGTPHVPCAGVDCGAHGGRVASTPVIWPRHTARTRA